MEKQGFIVSRIIMNGFKSFPFKTQVEISPDITCIVGPNGCGKSNIADAIQWVLGEQKPTEVRLKEMSEVIFQGSSKRKPYSFAEVTLILKKNGSNETIKIARRIHSSGESDYYINEKSVRLKDLKDFLKSENLNINSYSILGQGEIERVALLKPYEKRYLIEECAGIFRFKEKEKVTLLRLEDTERNLNLTRHLLSEQEKMAHSLKIQAGRAKTFRQIEEEEKNLLKLSFAQQRDIFLKEMEETRDQILKEEEKRVYMVSTLKELENKMETLEEEKKKKEKEELGLREKMEEILLNLQKTKFEIDKRVEKINSLNLKNENIEREMEFLKNEGEKEKSLILEKESIFEKKEEEIKKLDEEILQKESFIREIENKIKLKEAELKEANHPLLEIVKNKSEYGTNLSVIRDTIEKTKANLSLEEAEIKTFMEKKNRLEEEEKKFEREIMEKSEEFLEIEENLKLESNNFEKFQEDLREKEKEIQNIRAEIYKLRELKDRELSLVKDHEKEKNTLAFLLKPPLEWEKFVDLLFDEVSSAIPSEENLEEGGLFMKERKIPLPEIEGAVPVRDIVKLTEGAPQWILDGLPPIYFVKEREKLKELSLNYPYFAFFDGEGNFLKGSLSGRPPFSKSGVLGSLLKVEIFQRNIEQMENLLLEKEKIFAEMERDLVKKAEELKEKKNLREELLLKISDLKNYSGQIKIQHKNIVERIEEISIRIENHKKNIEELEKEQIANFEEAEKIIEKEEEIKEKIETIKREIENIKIQEAQERLSLQENLKNLKEKEIERERTRGEIIKFKEDLLKNEERIKNLKEEKENNFSEIRILSEEKENLDKEYFSLRGKEEKLKEEVSIMEQEKAKLEEQLKDFQNKTRNLRDELEENLRIIEGFKSKEEILKVRMEELEEKTRSFLNLELESLPSNNEEGLNEKIQKIKEKKERFGQINPLAEKELEEVLGKVEFIKKQKEDLETSCKALKDDLRELEKEALKRFQETFQKVNENFQKYFSYLFGGGQAKIILQNEENPLEAGIELVVEPPGKKIQHIMLLSGGERALVSFAFLLSLFSVSPSPFLFLDEADASLDDFNVERFINLINKLKEEIQIILVTHNRRTMEEAELLLGVTMDEPGLSKILPLSPKEVLEKFA